MKKPFLIALFALFLNPIHADAADRIAFSVGYYDVLDDQDGTDFRIEYRPDSEIFIERLKPFAGIEVTSQGSLWGGGGLLYDWNVKPNWYVTPSIGAGLYSDGGSDVDLDHPIQFRTQLELSYEFKNENRLSISLSHMSNGGLGDSNPGTETLSLGYAVSF